MEFYIFEKVNNTKDTKLRVTLINNRIIFLKYFSALHNPITKWCSAFLNIKKTESWLIKSMHSFEVHSNESACRKSGRLGLEQVIHWYRKSKR